MKAERFSIHIPEETLDDMKRRLRATRWPDDFGNENWHYGVEKDWLQDMTHYWAHEFDWRRQEADINRFPHYRVVIDDIPIHYIHVRGKGPNPIPLILTHGWPWTFWDWKDTIDALADPGAHGGDPADAFDVIVPSLPGFGFSTPLRTTGVDVRRIGKLWVRLMRELLGYPKFAAAGGDWGALITAELGHAHPEHLHGVYLFLFYPPGVEALLNFPRSDYAPEEAWMADRAEEAMPLITSHVAVQLHDPQTLAYAMADSPVGTAAWIWERRRAWSDCDGDVEALFGRDFLCTTASLYWLSNSIGSSFRIYAEQFRKPWPALNDRKPIIPAPTGFAVSPKEVVMAPRAWVEKQCNLMRYTVFSKGGHFAPSEHPRQVIDECRTFFHTLR